MPDNLSRRASQCLAHTTLLKRKRKPPYRFVFHEPSKDPILVEPANSGDWDQPCLRDRIRLRLDGLTMRVVTSGVLKRTLDVELGLVRSRRDQQANEKRKNMSQHTFSQAFPVSDFGAAFFFFFRFSNDFVSSAEVGSMYPSETTSSSSISHSSSSSSMLFGEVELEGVEAGAPLSRGVGLQGSTGSSRISPFRRMDGNGSEGMRRAMGMSRTEQPAKTMRPI
jgi:hypothetical protein